MHVYHFSETNPRPAWLMLASDLLDTKPIHTGEWQAMDTGRSPAHATHELEDVSLVWDQVPTDPSHVMPAVDTAWAREHFAERVSGIPLNPAPSHVRWPYAVRGNADHTHCPTCDSPEPRLHPSVQAEGEVSHICQDSFHSGEQGKFDHTYPERFWPKHAGHYNGDHYEYHPGGPELEGLCGGTPGIRFHYGDLNDVVSLMLRNPLTRQAYLPIWFPEDTGAGLATYPEIAKFGGPPTVRVPCTLGYHFMQRGGFLSCRYYIRSCDLYRHLSNDAYFAVALMRWICAELKRQTMNSQIGLNIRPGKLVMHVASMHAFVGDKQKIRDRINLVSSYDDDEQWGAAI